jgi:predicted Zn-dependent protease
MRALAFLCVCIVAGCRPTAPPKATPEPAPAAATNDEDAEVGARADAELLQAIPLYKDAKLNAYVQSVADRVFAKVKPAPSRWNVRILDSSYVTVRSAPGGYVYLTRSTLAHFGSEAELAGAIAHEAAHVVRRHYLTSVRFLAKRGIDDNDLGKLSNADRLELLALFRDNEREADRLAVGYLAEAGYAPQGLSRVIELFAEIERRAGGHPIPALLRTHPETKVRLAALANVPQSGDWKRDEFLDQIDGLLFGDDPRQGYLYAKRYINPSADLQIDLAAPWRAQLLGRDLIAAVPGTSTVLVLSQSDHATLAETQSAMGGKSSATSQGGLQVILERVPQEQGLVARTAIIQTSMGIQVLILVTPQGEENAPVAEDVLRSIRKIAEPELREIRPLRVRVAKLDKASTLRAFDGEKPSRTSLATLSLINRVEPEASLPAGTRVKRIDQ